MKVEFDTDWTSLVVGAGVAWGEAGTGIEIRFLFWALIIRWGLALVLLLAFAQPVSAQRTYWPVPLDTLAIGHLKHTHAETRGQVAYVRVESDGDVHIKIVSPWNPKRFIIAECIPRLPCARPRVGADIIIRGITRRDPEHGWTELHPVEGWTYATAGE